MATASVLLLLVGIVAATAIGRIAPRQGARPAWLTWATCLVLALLLLAQLRWPGLLPLMQREPGAIASPEAYRLFTALWFQDGGLAGGVFNVAMLAVVGSAAEHVLGRAAWLAIYLIGGLASELVALAWQPVGAGNSIAYMSLAGALCGCAFAYRLPRLARLIAGVGMAAAILLCLRSDIHGAAMLIGFALLILIRLIFDGKAGMRGGALSARRSSSGD